MIASRSAALTALCAICIWAAGFSTPARPAEAYSEDSVKAAFIYRFAGYVEWPVDAEPQQVFTIAVMGSNEIASRLEALMVDRKLRDRPVKVRRIIGLQDARDAQILYIGPKHRADLKEVLSLVGKLNILTITDEEQGLESGSVINFLMADRRVRFEVSLDAAHRAQLDVSSELLSVAARVQGSRYRPPAEAAR